MKLFFLLLLLTSNVFAKTSKWHKHFKLVSDDIRTVESLRTNDIQLRIRLFELYGEKLTLLLEKENEYRMKFLEKGDDRPLKVVLNNQKKTFSKLENISRLIESQTKKPKILTKINYYRSLNYYMVKKFKKFYFHIKKAEKLNKDKALQFKINTKLADYHYNEKQYKQASVYYKKVVKNKKNKWITKAYFNLAWSELKLERNENAIKFLKITHDLSKIKGNFIIGEQLYNSVLLFYAYAEKTKEGLSYMRKIKLTKFDNLLKYLHYVFENGKKSTTSIIIKFIAKQKLTLSQEYMFLTKKILIYRTMKKFSLLQKSFSQFKNKLLKLKKIKVKKESKLELVSGIKSYTGYIQELVKSRALVSKKRKRIYLNYIAYNFSVLKYVDPEHAIDYYYYEGESYFAVRSFKKAASVYMAGINASIKLTKYKKTAMVGKSFDSLFKSLENSKKPTNAVLVKTYTMYLKFYPKSKKSQDVFQRLITLYRRTKRESKMFALLRSYNKNYPQDIDYQRGVYKEVMNHYIDKRDVPSLRRLKTIVKKGFLEFKRKEITKLNKIISQIEFAYLDNLAKKGQIAKAILGFSKLASNKKNNYNLRSSALKKKMYYQNEKLIYRDLSKSIIVSLKLLKIKDKKKFQSEYMFYIQNICVSDLQKECLKLARKIKSDKTLSLTKELDNLGFKLEISRSTIKLSHYKMANTKGRMSQLFEMLVLDSPNLKSKLFNKFYRTNSFKIIIDKMVEMKFWKTYYDTINFDKAFASIRNVSIKSLRGKYSKIVKTSKAVLKKATFKLPKAPKVKKITFEIFSVFNQKIEKAFVGNVQKIDLEIGRINPNIIPTFLSKLVINYRAHLDRFMKYSPTSKEKGLEKALNKQLESLEKVLEQKLMEYSSLYYRSLSNTISGIGAMKYHESFIEYPIDYQIKGDSLWKN